MISKHSVKEKSEELNIPFKNLLPAVICESIIEIISESLYCNELFLCNGHVFDKKVYKASPINEIYYEYGKEIDEKMAFLYKRDILKEIIAKASREALVVKGSVDDKVINLNIEVDEMYVPIRVYFTAHKQTHENDFEELVPIMHENRVVKYLANAKEEELSKHLVEIIDKLELINDMDHYYHAYEILSRYPISGRKVNDRLRELLKENRINLDTNRAEIIYSYKDYTYMKRKWKVELRQKKVSEPGWSDTIECLNGFVKPIWDTVESDRVFLGDWMPQLKRFLD